MSFSKHYISNKQTKTAGMLVTESQSGDAPKPPFPMKSHIKLNNPEIMVRSTIEICPYFWVCLIWPLALHGLQTQAAQQPPSKLKKPLNTPNQKDSDDYKDTYNADKKPDPGAYAQIKADPNAALREAGGNYET